MNNEYLSENLTLYIVITVLRAHESPTFAYDMKFPFKIVPLVTMPTHPVQRDLHEGGTQEAGVRGAEVPARHTPVPSGARGSAVHYGHAGGGGGGGRPRGRGAAPRGGRRRGGGRASPQYAVPHV